MFVSGITTVDTVERWSVTNESARLLRAVRAPDRRFAVEIIARNAVQKQEAAAHMGAMLEKTYRDAMSKCRVPDHMHDGLITYLVHHRVTGSFLRAVLDNNLRLAVGRADEKNRHALPQIVEFLVNWAPMAAWGGEELVDRWTEAR